MKKNITPEDYPLGTNLRAIELAYKLLYQLCSHPNLSEQWSPRSWLLKSVAVEVKIASDKGLVLPYDST